MRSRAWAFGDLVDFDVRGALTDRAGFRVFGRAAALRTTFRATFFFGAPALGFSLDFGFFAVVFFFGLALEVFFLLAVEVFRVVFFNRVLPQKGQSRRPASGATAVPRGADPPSTDWIASFTFDATCAAAPAGGDTTGSDSANRPATSVEAPSAVAGSSVASPSVAVRREPADSPEDAGVAAAASCPSICRKSTGALAGADAVFAVGAVVGAVVG